MNQKDLNALSLEQLRIIRDGLGSICNELGVKPETFRARLIVNNERNRVIETIVSKLEAKQ